MYFVCDESGVFDIKSVSGREWRNAIVGGVLIGYKAHCWWLKNYFRYPKKAQDYSNNQMLEVLQSLVKLRVIGICNVVHLTADLHEATECQANLILPIFNQIANQPDHLKGSIQAHLEVLQKMKPQTFAKAWTLLELITQGVSSYLNCIGNRRSQDQRFFKIIIDDQVEQMLPTLEYFIWFFLNCRASKGIFSLSSGVPKKMEKHILGKVIDLTALIKIVVGRQGEKLDDKLPELLLADIICNFMNRRFKGELPNNVCDLIDKIVKTVHLVYFGGALEHHVKIPDSVQPGFSSLNLIYV